MSHLRSSLYTFAIVCGFTLLQAAIWDYVRPASFLLFYPACLFSAFLGDGFFAILLSLLAAFLFFLSGPRQVTSPDLVRAAVFTLSSTFFVSLVRALRRTQSRATLAAAEEREARMRAETSEKRLRWLTEQVKDHAIFVLDLDGRIKSWNSGAEIITGHRGEDVLGHSYELLFTEEQRSKRRAQYQLSRAAKEGHVEDTCEWRRRDGRDFWVDGTITAVYDEAGAQTGFSAVIRDVTVQKEAEDELRAALAELRQEKDLRDRFVAALSHDLRNPLTAIKTSADFILRKPGEAQVAAAFAGRILSSVNRADSMIRDLLDVSQIRAGHRLPLLMSQCDLSEVSRVALEELAMAYGDRFVLEAPGALWGYWNADALRRVIENLCTNAVKYGSEDTSIQVTLVAGEKGPQIRVHNYGEPIPPEQQARLFEAFLRAEFSHPGKKPGWGLGLTLVRGIVESHRGEVSVESSQPAGTTFTVTLPWDSRPPSNL